MAVDIFLVIPSTTASGTTGITISAEPIQDQYFATTFKGVAVIEVLAFSLGEEAPVTIGSTSTGAGAGKAQLQELVIEKRVDKLSRALFAISVTGSHIKRMQLYVRRSGGTTLSAKPYLVYGFDMVFVNRIDWSASGGDEWPHERVTFAYGAVALGYYPQKADGTFDVATKTSWSQVTNTTAETDAILTGF